jgi:hypothetical protein
MIHVLFEFFNIDRDPSRSTDDRINAICNKININDKPLILDGTGEGLFSVNLSNAILKKLKATDAKIILNVDPKGALNEYEVILDYTSGVCNFYHWYTDLQVINNNWKNIEINYHFVSLARRASINRALYIKDILDFFGDISLASFGLRPIEGDLVNRTIQSILKPYQIPLCIDINDPLIDSAQKPPTDKIFTAMFNIVLETNDPDYDEIRITEKGLKPFAWHQIPIFVSGNGYVDRMRSLGFDLFDDLLDNHSYNESHPSNYRLKVMSLCKKLHNKYPTIKELQNLRSEIWDRLDANNKLLAKYVGKDCSRWNIKLDKKG